MISRICAPCVSIFRFATPEKQQPSFIGQHSNSITHSTNGTDPNFQTSLTIDILELFKRTRNPPGHFRHCPFIKHVPRLDIVAFRKVRRVLGQADEQSFFHNTSRASPWSGLTQMHITKLVSFKAILPHLRSTSCASPTAHRQYPMLPPCELCVFV